MEVKNGKTVTEIAEELGIDRQRVYRYVRAELMNDESVILEGRVLYLKEPAEQAVREHFADVDKDKSQTNKESIIEVLQSEIDAQEREIERLHKLLQTTHNALDNAQKLQAAAEQRYLQLEQQTAEKKPDESEGIFRRVKRFFTGSNPSSENSDN
jgi:predicted transcriptional regulator